MGNFSTYVKWGTYLYTMYFISCIVSYLFQPLPYIDPSIRPYVEHWVDEAQKRNIDISKLYQLDSIVIQEFPTPNTLGMCYLGQRKIGIIAPTGQASQFSKFHYLVIIYHELGHCVLGRHHTCDRLAIMNPHLPVSDMKPHFVYWEYIVDDYWDNRGMVCTSQSDPTNKPCCR